MTASSDSGSGHAAIVGLSIAELDCFNQVGGIPPHRRLGGNLPDIPDADRSLVLIWDSVWTEERGDRPQTVIRDADRVLFTKPANWQKYARLQDVVPTRDSEFWLYGDTLAGPQIREFIRERVFGTVGF